MQGLMLFAHGSRDPEWAKPFNELLRNTQSSYTEHPIALAYLEKMQPDFFEAAEHLIQESCTHITLLPLFLARGGHLKADLSSLLREAEARWPSIEWQIAPCIGDSPFMQTALTQWIGTHLPTAENH